MIPQEEARQLYLDDLVHSVGQTFLSLGRLFLELAQANMPTKSLDCAAYKKYISVLTDALRFFTWWEIPRSETDGS